MAFGWSRNRLLEAMAAQRELAGGSLRPGGVRHTSALGAPSPVPSQPAGDDPVAAFYALLSAYRKRTGRQFDPLSERRGQAGPGQSGPARTSLAHSPVQLLTGGDIGGGLIQRTTSGPRAGLLRQSYDLGDGRTAHVYYDEHGRRQVQVFRRP